MAHAATNTLAGFDAVTPAKARKAGKTFFARIGEAFMESRLRSAEREIARHRHLIERFSAANDVGADLPFTRR